MSPSHVPHSLSTKITRVSLTLTACLIMTSCSNFNATALAKKSINSMKVASLKSVKSVKSASKSMSESVAGIMPSRVPIATVRADDLQKMPTGADRALAWERHLNAKKYVSNSRRWFAPKGYKAPTLPDERTLPANGGLLPPLHPGERTALEANGSLPAL